MFACLPGFAQQWPPQAIECLPRGGPGSPPPAGGGPAFSCGMKLVLLNMINNMTCCQSKMLSIHPSIHPSIYILSIYVSICIYLSMYPICLSSVNMFWDFWAPFSAGLAVRTRHVSSSTSLSPLIFCLSGLTTMSLLSPTVPLAASFKSCKTSSLGPWLIKLLQGL